MPCTVGRQHAYSGSMHISSRSNLIPWAFLGLAKAWRGARLGAGRTGMSAHTVWRVDVGRAKALPILHRLGKLK